MVIPLVEEVVAIVTRRTPTIFVADDSRLICEVVSFVLRGDGLEAVSFVNGAELLEAALRNPPDAIVLDIEMPIMDGLETLLRLVAAPKLSSIPVMMLTSNSHEENVQQALSAGARDFIVKPFEPDLLRRRVWGLLEQPRLDPFAQASVSIVTPTDSQELPRIRLTPAILVVDDHAAITEIAAELLAERFDVTASLSGASALQVATRLRPDLVILDLFMPVMSGVEMLQRLRAMPECATTQILAMTLGIPDEAGLVDWFDGTIRKPLERVALLRAIGAALRVPGLFSFYTAETAVVLRFHRNRIWDGSLEGAPALKTTEETGIPVRFWDTDIVESLVADCERAFASMLENGQILFVIDLERLIDLPNHQLGAIVSAVRGVLSRALECRMVCRLAVPQMLQSLFVVVANEFRVGMYLRVSETLRDVRPRRR